MTYRNKTYIIFDADTDMNYYRLIQAWDKNPNFEFEFHNAHGLNNITEQASEDQIKRKLRERMKNTKLVIVLIGKNTKNLYKFVRWEIELAIELNIPIIAVNLDGSSQTTDKMPPILRESKRYATVPYSPDKIANAMRNFPNFLKTTTQTGPWYYQ